MNLPVRLDPLLDSLARRPDRTGIFCDFDGTLAPIVDRPEDARPHPGAAQTLAELAGRFAVVAVISGRAIDDLRSRFDPQGVVLAGSYGRQRSDRPDPGDTRDWHAIAEAAEASVGGWDGVVVERKGAGVALHYRLAPERSDEVATAAEAVAASWGLEVRPGRMVVELTAPGPGKAEALRRLVEERDLETFVFCGDDVADAEAFAWARGSGRACVLVGVRSDESPGEIEALADVVVDSPDGVVQLLGDLLGRF